jgi:PPOX class probable F420-dependent enzyme
VKAQGVQVILDEEACRDRFQAARHAYLATADRAGVPHVVPVTFATDRDVIVIGVDHKPKTTTDLKRLRNIRENSFVAVLADRYEDDWRHLWWVRADGAAEIVDLGDPEHRRAVELLAARYEQYRTATPKGPVIRIRVIRWRGWAYGR